jgi:hypothetical protein
MPSGNLPVFSGTVDLTPDILNAAKKAGPNAQGNYSFRVALWDNDKRDKDTSPHFKGQVTVNKMENSPKAYSSFWKNDGNGAGSGSRSSSSDDLF